MDIMLLPFLICLVIAAIHGYLGIHVITRKVIFVDLALAQVAALGAIYATLLGYDPRLESDTTAIYLFSLGFTIIGAGIFSLTRMRYEKVPQEAFIGIVYAASAALGILLVAKSPGEAERVKYMLIGNVFAVREDAIVITAKIYAIIALIHYLFRRQFFKISLDPEGATTEGLNVKLWDFIFYLSFGIVITISVSIAGVLLVFCYLVVPAACAVMLVDGILARIVIACIVGTISSIAGVILSYHADFPTGPSVCACLAAMIVLIGVVRLIILSQNKFLALVKTIASAAILTLIFYLSTFLYKGEVVHPHEPEYERLINALHGGNESTQLEAIHHLAEKKDTHAVPELLKLLRDTKSDRIIEHICKALPDFDDSFAVATLVELDKKELDPFLRLDIASAILRLKSPQGFQILVDIVENSETELSRQKALELINKMTGKNFKTTSEIKDWWTKAKDKLRWRDQTGRFE